MERPLVSVELKQRAISGIVMIAAALAAIYHGGLAVVALIAVLGMIAMSEWVVMFRPQRQLILIIAGIGSIAFLVAAGWFLFAHQTLLSPQVALLLPIFLAGAFLLLACWFDRRKAAWLGLGLFYVGSGCLALLYLRLLPDYAQAQPNTVGVEFITYDMQTLPDSGLILTLLLVLAVWGTDIGAYFTGRTLGGPKLCPAISPSKTWSGLLGGMALATLLAWLVTKVHPMRQPEIAVGLAPVLAVVAQLGDFFESYMKRRCGVKDSGRLIPGHGGVLDRIDGLISAAIFLMLFQMIVGETIAWW